ncbi:response regulator [Desulfobacterales bacterium HSG16]|nr:response regulator [Desulfobacterales bacterium HSG16]
MNRILIVDDEKSIRLTLREFLRDDGYEVHVAENADEAMSLLQQTAFDVLVTDIILPKVTGVDLLKTIRQTDPHVQVVMMTGEPTAETASESCRAGAFDYLFKPISKDAILKVVRNAMRIKLLDDEKRRLEEENRRHREELELLVEERTAKLIETEETARVLLNSTSNAALLMDMDGRISVLNTTMAEWFTKTPEALVGECFYACLPASQAEFRRKMAEKVFQSKEPVCFQDEWSGKTLDNRLYPVFDPDGNVSRISFFSRDITEQKNLENQLRQAQKMEAVGTLAGGIAHDFNNILFPIMGYTEMCISDVEPESPVERQLEEVLRAAHRAKDLVRQILTFSRQREQEQIPIQIKQILKEAMKLIRSTLPATIDIHQDIHSESFVFADPVEIHQVIMNLCTNAYHAMRDKGGILEIILGDTELSRDDDLSRIDQPEPGIYICLTVKDTGCGMNQLVMEKIFDPYFTTKKQGEGTGLGLAVIHGIVRNIGGHIDVTSKSGEGTVFTVFFPQVEKRIMIPEAQVSKNIPAGNDRILLVDDEKAICNMIRQSLERLGYQVTAYNSSSQALSEFKNHPEDFDILLTDMTMPEMTGLDLSREVMRIRPDLPIVLLTGYSHQITKEKAMELGIRHFIMKPIPRKKLAEVIEQTLRKKH